MRIYIVEKQDYLYIMRVAKMVSVRQNRSYLIIRI